MKLECGPLTDRRTLEIELPEPKRLGIFVSGGMDSALLYYLFCKLNHDAGYTHKIIPYTVLRQEGAKKYALPIINHIHRHFQQPVQTLKVAGDPTLPEDQQVKSGVMEVLQKKWADIVYVGVIEALEIHMVGWQPIPAKETEVFKTPLHNLNKSHIIDLLLQLGQQDLLFKSHSCITSEGRCGTCNGCNERSWGFDQLQLIDTGKN
jgi:hypothetical protein